MPSRNVHASGERRKLRRPTVLILKDVGIEPFDQLASCLRRRGIGVVRVRTRRVPARMGRTRWIRDHWLYDGCLDLSEFAQRDGPLDPADIADVMYNETIMATGLENPLIRRLADRSLAFAGQPPSLLLDKFAVNAHLRQHGVLTPRQISAAEANPAQAVDSLGLPLIVKDRIGVAGEGVRLADSLQAVEQAVPELGTRHGCTPFYQQYIKGEMVMYGALVDRGEPLIEHGIKMIAAQCALGPSARVRLFDEPGLLEAGRTVVRALGCRGLAEIGFIRDDDGAYWHIDANCRAWGNMISLLALGIDYVDAYAALITGSPYAEPARATAANEADVLPFSLFDAARFGSRQEIVAQLGHLAAVCRKGPGLRYAAMVGPKTMALLMGRGLRRLAAGFHPAPTPRLGALAHRRDKPVRS